MSSQKTTREKNGCRPLSIADVWALIDELDAKALIGQGPNTSTHLLTWAWQKASSEDADFQARLRS